MPTKMEKYGAVAAMVRKADRLNLELKWEHDRWRARTSDRKTATGKSIEELSAFIRGFEMGKAFTEEAMMTRTRGDICGGEICDDLNCSCHGDNYDDEEDCDCGPDGCGDHCDCDCHMDESEDDMDDDPDADADADADADEDEGDDDIPF